MNNIQISGNIGKDPVLRYTPDMKAVLSFSVALYTGGSKEEGYKDTQWFGVSVWGEDAERLNAELHKGDKVTVTGMMRPPRTYTRDGAVIKADPEVTANLVELGDKFKDEVTF